MKAKSKWPALPRASRLASVSSAGAMRRSMRPETPADLADVATDEAAVARQGAGDSQRAVAGERADLEAAPGARSAHEQREKRGLVGADLHAGLRQLRGLFAQPARRGALARVRVHIVLDAFRHHVTSRHGLLSSGLNGCGVAGNEGQW